MTTREALKLAAYAAVAKRLAKMAEKQAALKRATKNGRG